MACVSFFLLHYPYYLDSDCEVWEENNLGIADEVDVLDLDEVDLAEPETSASSTYNGRTKVEIIITWIVAFVAAFQRRFFIPDLAIGTLLKFLWTLLKVLSPLSAEISHISQVFPSSFYAMLKFAKIKNDDFKTYVVCPNPCCCALYKLDDCVDGRGEHRESKHCSASVGKYKRCNSILLKKVHLSSGKVVFHPIKTYCFRSLKKSLINLLERPAFYEECRLQRQSYKDGNKETLFDIYDGKIWREFQSWEGVPFLSEDHTYGLMMNIDWFQPFKRAQYSMGAIYLSVMNLPRQIRFRPENIVLVGLIPGPDEPRLTIDTFLRPLVDELIELWNGVHLAFRNRLCLVRCALLCVACDQPAARKVCGFLSHSAMLGCPRCYKNFPGKVGNKNYSGFETKNWKNRSVFEHRKHIKKILNASSCGEKKDLIAKYGCRYSELLRLPYFDPIRMTIIDPMHCLFLGIAKHIMKRVWLQLNILKMEALPAIEATLETINFKFDMGRIPKNLFTSFSSFTADQFKNWTNIFSLVV